MKTTHFLQAGILLLLVSLNLLSCRKQAPENVSSPAPGEPEQTTLAEVSPDKEESSVQEPVAVSVPDAPLLCQALSLPPDTPLTKNDALDLICDFSRNGEQGPDDPLLLHLTAYKTSSDIPDSLEIKGSFVIVATPHNGGGPLAYCFDTIDGINFFYENSDGEKYGTQFLDNYVLPLDDGYYIDADRESPFLPGPPEAGTYTVNFYLVFEDHSCIWGEPVEIVLYEEPAVVSVPDATLLCQALSLPSDTPLTRNDALKLDCDLYRDGGEGPDKTLVLTLKARKMSSDVPDYLKIKGSFVIVATPQNGGDTLVHFFNTINDVDFFYENSDGEKFATQFFDNCVLPRDDGYYIDASKEYLLLPGPPEAGAYTVNFYLVFEDHSCIWGEPLEITLYDV